MIKINEVKKIAFFMCLVNFIDQLYTIETKKLIRYHIYSSLQQNIFRREKGEQNETSY
jgi:hypothetical protein